MNRLIPCLIVITACVDYASAAFPGRFPFALGQPAESFAIRGMEDFLGLFDVTPAELAQVNDNSWTDDDQDLVLRIMTCLPRLPYEKVLQWRQSEFDWTRSSPQRDRGRLFLIQGRATAVQPLEVSGGLSDRLGVKRVFRCQVEFPAGGSAVVLARRVPQPWTETEVRELDERASATALLVKRMDERFVFVCDRIAWHPDHVNAQLGIQKDHVLLAGLGVDVGSFDTVQPHGELVGGDRECFYQFLAAMARADGDVLAKAARTDVRLVDLLKDMKAPPGRLCTLRGTARRAVPVFVDDADLTARLGIRHYYELDVFLEPEVVVRLVRGTNDDAGKVYNTYPVVFCVSRLPEGFPEGEVIHEEVAVTGAYLKMWAYPSRFLGGEAGGRKGQRLQTSPLLIGRCPMWIRPASSRGPGLSLMLGVAFVLVVAAVFGALWWTGRADRRFMQKTLAQFQPPDSLEQCGDESPL